MNRTDSIRVLIVDDHKVVRLGYAQLLHAEGFTVAGEAASGEEALEMLPVVQPDVALVDIAMNGMDGVELTRRIEQDYPEVRVVIVSMHNESYYIERALEAGAEGYVLKDNIDELMREAVSSILAGQMYLCNRVRTQVDGH